MQDRVKTSFIPKASLKIERRPSEKSNPIALVNIATAALLVVSIIVSGGLFLYERFTVQSIAKKQDDLDRSRGAFEPATIKELSRLDARIEAGKTVLAGHVALSRLFDDLEVRTFSSVRFADLSYTVPSPGRVILSMSGKALSFNAVALQAEEFSKSSVLTDPIFSNVNINSTGSIDFNFTATINPERLRYIGAAPQSPPTP